MKKIIYISLGAVLLSVTGVEGMKRAPGQDSDRRHPDVIEISSDESDVDSDHRRPDVIEILSDESDLDSNYASHEPASKRGHKASKSEDELLKREEKALYEDLAQREEYLNDLKDKALLKLLEQGEKILNEANEALAQGKEYLAQKGLLNDEALAELDSLSRQSESLFGRLSDPLSELYEEKLDDDLLTVLDERTPGVSSQNAELTVQPKEEEEQKVQEDPKRSTVSSRRRTTESQKKMMLQKKYALIRAKERAVILSLQCGNMYRNKALQLGVAARDFADYSEKVKLVIDFMKAGRKVTSSQILDRYVDDLNTCMEVAQEYENAAQQIYEGQIRQQKKQRFGGRFNPLNWFLK